MKKIYYSKKLKEFEVLSRRVRHLLKHPNKEASIQLDKLKKKLYNLIQQLKFAYSRIELKKVLGGAIILLGLSFSNEVKGQWFDSPLTNPFGLDSVIEISHPAIADLDGDGDLDMLVGEYYGDLQYFENIGTASNPIFDEALANPFGINLDGQFAFPTFVDIDDDGDYDLFTGDSYYDYYTYEYGGTINYLENTGTATNPQFADPVENPFSIESVERIPFASFVDLDDDGDFDIIVGSSTYEYISYDEYNYLGNLHYYENIGSATEAEFDSPTLNPFGLEATLWLAAPTLGDIDSDGDMDLFVGEYYGNIQFFENTGSADTPEFVEAEENPFGLVSTNGFSFPALGDLDDDGDLDLMIGEYYGALQYFENVNTVGVAELNSNSSTTVYPNPARELIQIDSENQIARVDIIDVVGKIYPVPLQSSNQLYVGDLSPGMYSLKIIFEDGTYSVGKILKE